MKKWIFIIAIGILALIAIGCNPKENETPQAVKNLQKFKYATVEHPNEPAPEFMIQSNKQKTLSSELLKGKTYILQGFAPGCSSCAKEIATLNKVYDKYKENVEIISLDVASEDLEGALDTKEQFNGGDWHWAIDTDNVAIKFGMASLESTYIVDKDGVIRYKDDSLSDSGILIDELSKII